MTAPGHLIAAFDAALANGRCEAHFQPVLNADGGVAFAEALFRCPDGNGRHIGNGELIPALRRDPRMAQLTSFMVLQAIDRAAEWRELGLLDRVSLNFPLELLEDHEFLWWLLDTVVASDIAPGNLLLEISCEDFAGRNEAMEAGIRRLVFAGVRLALDLPALDALDLGFLQDETLHLLKISRNAIGDPRSIHGRSLLSAVRFVCGDMALDWAVVGVESAEDAQLLKECGARAMQGFHFAPPMDRATCTAWLGGR